MSDKTNDNGGNPPKKQAKKVEAEETAKAPSPELAAVQAFDNFEEHFAPLIQQKVRAGLTREQAMQAIRNQIKESPEIAAAQLEAASQR